MKKIIGFLSLFFLFVLVSCGEQLNEEIRFEIEADIQLEIDHYNSKESLSTFIKAYKGDQEISYFDLEIKNKDKIELGRVEFILSYEEKAESFFVTFVDNYSIVKLHSMNGDGSYEVRNGTTLEDLSENLTTNGYTINEFYIDNHYKKALNIDTPIQGDVEVYVSYSYLPEGISSEININNLTKELDTYIERLIEETEGYIPAWNKEGFKGRWNYIDGVFLNSLLNLYKETGRIEYKNFFLKYINYYIDEAGRFINPETLEETGYRSGELDSVCASRILFDAYEMTQDDRYLTAIHKTYRELVAMPYAYGSNNYWHKTTYENQIWLDGMYMYVPFLARYARLANSDEFYQQIKKQYQYIRENMFDEEKKLYYHGNQTTKEIFWADKTTGNSENFWLRSNGWFIVSLVDVLEYFPEGEEKEYLHTLLEEAIEGILQYQDKTTKMFYQLIDKGANAYFVSKEYLSSLKNYQYGNADAWIKNYLESSGSSMIAYTLLKASRLGYISPSYETLGKEIFEAVYKHSFDGALKDICITAGLGPDSNPYRDGSVAYYLAEPAGSDDAKGVGPFLMAYIEYAKQQGLLKSYHTVRYVNPIEVKEVGYPKGTILDSLAYPYIPNCDFIGFYYDEEYTLPVHTLIVDRDVTIYLKYEKTPTKQEVLQKEKTILIDENFDNYPTLSLSEFTTWGTKGIYYINDKDKTNGMDLSLNHIVISNGYAYLYDNSKDGTRLIVDTGGVSSGGKGYMEVSLIYAGNSWTFFQMYGKRKDGQTGELFGLRFENGYLQYRLNGGNVQPPMNAIVPDDKTYKIYYEFNITNKLLTVTVDDIVLVEDLSLPEAESFYGIKIVTSDGLVKFVTEYNTIYVHRTAYVDNIILTLDEE